MNNLETIDNAKHLKAAESASNYESRIEYVNTYGEKPFARSILKGGTRIYDPNPADVMAAFRRVWSQRHTTYTLTTPNGDVWEYSELDEARRAKYIFGGKITKRIG